MADLKISQLNALAGASLADTDVLAVVDTSASETKKITSVDLVRYGYGLISASTLDGDIIEAGTTSARGTVQLTDSTSSTSTTTAATPNAVKSAYDLAAAALPKAGGTMTGAILADDASSPSTPGYAFDGDADTGIVRTGANEMALVTGGSARITLDASGNVVVPGNFTVQGTTTTIDTTTLVVKDKNIEMGAVATPTDVTADGGGITLKGTTDKTINWIDATDAWTFSEHVNIASTKEYRIAGTKVLDATSLGSGVVSSSLTSLGTVTTGTWSASTIAVDKGGTGQTTYTDGQLLIGNSTGNTLAKSTLTAGTGITITNGSGSITIASTVSGDVTLAGNNAFTGANTFTNSTGQIFRQAATQDGILLRGRAGGTSSYTAEVVPTTLTASRTITLPDATGTVALLGTAQTFTAAQTFTGGLSDSAGSVRTLPQNSQTSGYTLVVGDTGKHISITTGGVTVPAAVFSAGDIITIYNNSTSNQTITQGSSVTLRQSGTANTGNRTLAQYGVATVLCVASNTFVISGSGLT